MHARFLEVFAGAFCFALQHARQAAFRTRTVSAAADLCITAAARQCHTDHWCGRNVVEKLDGFEKRIFYLFCLCGVVQREVSARKRAGSSGCRGVTCGG
jgi:hypothetical protein